MTNLRVASLVEALQERAAAQPDREALRFLAESGEPDISTYRQLETRARAVAALLQQSASAGDRAVLLLPSGLDYVTVFYGCLYAGIIAVPAFPPESLRPQHLARLRLIVDDADPAVILAEPSLCETLRPTFGDRTILLSVSAPPVGVEDQWRRPDLGGDDVAFLQYTSGSTSAPKGVRVSHANLIANERLIRHGFGLTEDDTMVSWLPLYHDMGLIGGLLQPIFSGFRCVLMSPRSFLERPLRWLEAVSRYRGTISGGPDFAYRLCSERIAASAVAELDLTNWHTAFSGAEPIRPSTLDAFAAKFAPAGFRATSYFACYGLAEATLFVSGGTRGEGVARLRCDAAALAADRFGPGEGPVLAGCGHVQPEHAVRLVSVQDGTNVADDGVGEIWVAGPSVSQGYWRNPDATAEAFVERDGRTWLRTGDLGALHGGQIYLTGRLKDMLIVRGQNIYPQDLEQAIEDHVAAVRKGRVAAFALDRDGREVIGVAAEIGRAEREKHEPEALVRAIRQAVVEACQEAPALVALLNPGALPKTSSGKLQRAACRTALRDGSLDSYFVQDGSAPRRTAARRLPQTPHQHLLADIWAELLGVDEPALEDDFFALGGNSVTAVQMLARLRARLGKALELRPLFEASTLEEIADWLDREAHGPAPSLSTTIPATEGAAGVLSPAQERLWFLWTLDPHSCAYNIHASLRLAGTLDEAALQAVFDRIVARHETLRTRFADDAGRPVQIVMPAAPVTIRRHNVSGLATDERAAASARLADEAAREPFDLRAKGLLRVDLHRLAADDHVLAVTIHHIVADGWSMNLMMDEFGELYRSAVAGRSAGLPPLPIRYADFAAWQRRWLADGEGERQLGFWRARLGAEYPVVALPTDRPRPLRPSLRGDAVACPIEVELVGELKDLARRSGVTLPTLLLASFEVLLVRYCAQPDLRIGTTIANRNHVETERLIGFFVNMLVLRCDLSGDPRFCDFLDQVRDRALEAQAHQDLPFERLVEALQPERSLGQNPLFQVAYDHQWRRLDGLRKLPGLRVVAVSQPDLATQFDLILHTVEQDGALSATFTFSTDLFERRTIEDMADHWRALLRAVIAHPEARIGALPLLDPDRRRAALAQWTGSDRAVPPWPVPSACLHHRFSAQARLCGDGIALTVDGRHLTYAALDRLANRLAWKLRALGAGPEVLVGLLAERSAELVIGLLAILKAGGAYMPLDPSYPRDRLAYMLQDSGTRLILAQGSLHDLLPARDDLGIVDLDREEDWAGYPDTDPPSSVQPENLAYCIYTSGSTGRPKGVLITHANVLRLFEAADRCFTVDRSDVWALFHSYSFDVSVWEIFGALLYGGRLVVVPYYVGRAPEELHALLCRERVTVLCQTPSAFRQLVPVAVGTGADTLALRYVILAGEALDTAVLRPWLVRFGDAVPRLVNMYGPTETTVYVGFRPLVAADLDAARSPIGKPLADLTWYGLDPYLEPVPAGIAGELHVGGAGLARSYLNRPALTAERFIPDPFSDVPGARLYRTGDLARCRLEGDIDYLGRIDHQVKIRGYRIELGEIEARLRDVAAVREAVVVVRDDDAGEKRLVGYVVPDTEQLKRPKALEDVGIDEFVVQWESVFDSAYAPDKAGQGPSFRGWNDSYGDNPIPHEEMQEWLDATVARIASLQPRRLLEIGCGVGLLTQHLAPLCEAYRGTDISAQAITGLTAWCGERPALRHVVLTHQEASDFTGIAPGGLDTVVINSVAQYFPNVAYLVAVLEGAVRTLRPGGRIFVGDIRHRALLPLFHTTVSLARAPAGTTVAQLRARVERAIAEDAELVLSPDFFRQCAARLPGIAGVEMQLRRGRYDNELTRYRYDTVLHVADEPRADVDAPVLQAAGSGALRELDRMLTLERPAMLRLRGVANRRLARDVAAWRLLQTSEPGRGIDDLREALDSAAPAGEDPDAFWDLAAARGYEARVCWTDGDAEGRFDVVLYDPGRADGTGLATAPPIDADAFAGLPWDAYATDPLLARRRQQLGPVLRTRLKDNLPSYMLPAQIHVVDRLPLNANGKLDRKALAAADVATVKRAYQPPRSAVELGVAEIWRQMLGVEQVGLHDNFFELGGHSLLATQVASRIERDLGVKLSLRTLFEAQDLAGLAEAVEAASTGGSAADRLADTVLEELESLQGLSVDELERLAGAAS